MGRRRIAYWVYFLTVIFLGGWVLSLAFPPKVHYPWPEIVGAIILTLVTEASPVAFPRGGGSLSVGFAVIFASIIHFGTGPGSLVAALGTIRPREFRLKVPWEFVLFNRAQLVLSASAAGWVFTSLGGVPGNVKVFQVLPALLLSGLAYFVVNFLAVGTGLTLAQRIPFRTIWTANLKFVAPQYVAITPLGILLGVMYKDVGPSGVLLFFIPLMAARYSFQRYFEIRQIYLSTIEAMVRSIEARDPYTSGHSAVVRDYAVAVAKQMKLAESDIEKLEYVALLHDVGKLAVPDAVLLKKSKLSPEEYGLIKQHPVVGASIVGEVALLGDAVAAVRHHHEWFDGQGYPDGLSGDQIPLTARILGVCDAFDAMTSERPYKRAYTFQEGVEELRRCAGSQFDPAVVNEFLEVVKEVSPRRAEASKRVQESRLVAGDALAAIRQAAAATAAAAATTTAASAATPASSAATPASSAVTPPAATSAVVTPPTATTPLPSGRPAKTS